MLRGGQGNAPSWTVSVVVAIVVAIASVPSVAGLQYRFVDASGGDSTSSPAAVITGRLEARQTVPAAGSWGPVCTTSVATNAPMPLAVVACRSVGRATANATFAFAVGNRAAYATSSSFTARIDCAGTETSLDACTHLGDASTATCLHHAHEVVVSCGFLYRVTDTAGMSSPSNAVGRFEVQESAGGAWATVCDPANWFSAFGVSTCRALYPTATFGYGTTTGAIAAPGDATQPQFELRCPTSSPPPTAIADCNFTQAASCTHAQDVALYCTMSAIPLPPSFEAPSGSPLPGGFPDPFASHRPGGPDPFAGSSGSPAPFPFDPWSSAPFPPLEPWGPGSGPTWPNGFSDAPLPSVPLVPPSLYRFRLVDAAGDEIASPDNGSSFGLLLAQAPEGGPWMTVCSQEWSLSLIAHVFCREHTHPFPTATVGWNTSASMPSFLRNDSTGIAGTVTCSRQEASLTDCQVVADASGTCTHRDDAVVKCVADASAPQPPQASSPGSSPGSTEYDPIDLNCRQVAADQTTLESTCRIATSTMEFDGNFVNFNYFAICGKTWSAANSKVACHEAVGGVFVSYSIGQYPAEPDLGIDRSLSAKRCVGNETRLRNCPDVPNAAALTAACTHLDDVAVTCKYLQPGETLPPATEAPTNGIEVRLANETNASGLLQIKTNTSTEWHRVCVENFTQAAATAACRKLFAGQRDVAGFDGAVVAGFAADGGAPSHAATASCVGDRSEDLTSPSCVVTPVNDSRISCEAVHVLCEPTTSSFASVGFDVRVRVLPSSTDPMKGLVQVTPANTGQNYSWGTVCGASATSASAVALCRAAGINTSIATLLPASKLPIRRGPVYFDASTCDPSRKLRTCVSAPLSSQCTHDGDLAVDCSLGLYETRLVEGETSNSGRLEMRANSTLPWGTICAEGFSLTAAQVACKSLGFPASGATILSTGVPSATQGFAMANVTCTGGETSLAACKFSTMIPSICTHAASDVKISCAKPTPPSQSGCSSAADCASWRAVGSAIAPNCTKAATMALVSAGHVDCRIRAATEAAANGTMASYVMHNNSRACDIYTCGFNGTTVVAGPEGSVLYAPVGGTSLFFCTRELSCSGRGTAVQRDVYQAVSCNFTLGNPNGCLDTGVENSIKYVKSASACDCLCDTGFTRSDCAATRSLSVVSPTIAVTYVLLSTTFTSTQLETIGAGVTSALGDSTVTVTATLAGTSDNSSLMELKVTTLSGSAAAATAATLALLSDAMRARITAILTATAPAIRIIDITTPTLALRSTKSHVVRGSGQVEFPSFGNFTSDTALGNSTYAHREQFSGTLTVKIMGALPVQNSVYFDVLDADTNKLIGRCLPEPHGAATDCNAYTSCAVNLPPSPPTRRLKVYEQSSITCMKYLRRQADPLAAFHSPREIQLTVDSQYRLRNEYLPAGTDTGRLTYETQDARYVRGIYGVLGAAVGVVVIVMLYSVLFSTHKLIKFMTGCGGLAILGAYVWLASQSMAALGTGYTPTAFLFVDEFRSAICNESTTSPTPHRISVVGADGTCQLMQAYGTMEQPYWMKAYCHADNSNPVYTGRGLRVAFAQTESDCENAPFTSVTAGMCLAEQNFTIGKPTDQLQFLQFLCTNEAQAEERRTIISSTLDDVKDPVSQTLTTDVSPTDAMIRVGVNDFIYFHVGSWLSRAAIFSFPASKEDGSVALASFSQQDVLSGARGVAVQAVTFEGETPAASPRQSLMQKPSTNPGPGSSKLNGAAAAALGTTNGSDLSQALAGGLFNGFGTGVTVSSSQYGSGALRYDSIRGTMFDFGSSSFEDQGRTIVFWMRASNKSRGYVLLVTDAWTDEAGNTPIAQRLEVTMNTGRSFFAHTWTAYSALYVDGSARTIRFLYQNPLSSGGDSGELSWNTAEAIGNLFDDNWHFIAIGLSIDRGRTKAQLFVDGRTAYQKNTYQSCMADGRAFPAIRTLPAQVPVNTPSIETPRQGGVAFVGHLNAGVFGLTVHDELLDQSTVISMGAPRMLRNIAVDIDASRAAGSVFIVIFVVCGVVGGLQVMKEIKARKDTAMKGPNTAAKEHQAVLVARQAAKASATTDGAIVQEDDSTGEGHRDPDANAGALAGGAAGRVAQVKGALSSSPNVAANASKSVVVAVPIFVTVFQNMTLFFQGWRWPDELRVSFGWIYFPFSLDFIVIPTIPVWVTFIVQFLVAVIALGLVINSARHDRLEFQQRVIQHFEEHGLGLDDDDGAQQDDDTDGFVAVAKKDAANKFKKTSATATLPTPDVAEPLSEHSVMEFTIDERAVIGAVSRRELQDALEMCLRRPSDVNGEKVAPTVTLMMTAAPKKKPCCGGGGDEDEAPEYAQQLAAVDESVIQKLQRCGFLKIESVPCREKPLTTILTDLAQEYFPGIADATRARGLHEMVKATARYYALASALTSACDEIVERCLRLWRATLIEKVETALHLEPENTAALAWRAQLRADVNTARRQLLDRVGMRDGGNANTDALAYPTADDLRRLVLRCEADGKRTLFKAAAAAEIELGDDEQTKKRDAAVIVAILIRDGSDRRLPNTFMLALHLLNPNLQIDDTAPPGATAREKYTVDVTSAPLSPTSVTGEPRSHSPHAGPQEDQANEITRDAPPHEFKVLADSVLDNIADRGFEILVRRLKFANEQVRSTAGVLSSCHLVRGSVKVELTDDDVTATFTPSELPDEPTTADDLPIQVLPVAKCPLHGHRLFAALPDVHAALRQRRPEVYGCAHKANVVFKALCLERPDLDEDEKPRAHGCTDDVFFVCADDCCNFSVCENCMQLGVPDTILSIVAQRKYAIGRDGIATMLGLIFIMLAQSIYQPAVKAAVTTAFCHPSLSCHFPTCYDPATPTFLALSAGSAMILLFYGIGLFVFLSVVVWERKRTILQSSILRGYLTKHVNCAPGLCKEPTEYDPGHPSFMDIFNVAAEDDAFAALLREDRSIFKCLYEQFEFRWMTIQPVTLLFKALIVAVVLYGGEPNSLQIIVLSGCVETAQLLFFTVTEPYTDPWLDILAKSGSLHQVGQIGLMCFYRGQQFADPKDRSIAFVMVALAAIYLAIVVFVLVKVLFKPLVTMVLGDLERKKKREAELEAEAECERAAAAAANGSHAEEEGATAAKSNKLSEAARKSRGQAAAYARSLVRRDDADEPSSNGHKMAAKNVDAPAPWDNDALITVEECDDVNTTMPPNWANTFDDELPSTSL